MLQGWKMCPFSYLMELSWLDVSLMTQTETMCSAIEVPMWPVWFNAGLYTTCCTDLWRIRYMECCSNKSPPVFDDINNDWGKHYQWWGKPVSPSLAIMLSKSHIKENISSNIYDISSVAKPFEYAEPQA